MEKVIELLDGRRLRLIDTWHCCDGIHDCGSILEVYDADSDEFICELHNMSLPDDAESLQEFVRVLEDKLN